MNAQEYELAFVTALPSGVRIVEPHTLDFSKNPAGSLAFRYKHGWILINPLIPSRGLSGGGLARQHGHISGGHTTGHFLKGADGKVQFKAVNRYASKEDWIKEVKGSAASVAAKQASVKASVHKAEVATNAAAKLEQDGASKAAQAVAHQAAAQAHQAAASAFHKAGEGPAHKSGVLTHSAHSAIHTSKGSKLAQAAKVEEAAAKAEAEKAAAKAKLDARKAAATQISTKANDLSATAKNADASPKDKAKLHQDAANAHKMAQAAHEKAGNTFTAEAHGKAVAKHETVAGKQLEAHKSLEEGAAKQSTLATNASANAYKAEDKGESLGSQLIAHQVAADSHGSAHAAHAAVGNSDAAQGHLTQKTFHTAAAAELKEKKARQDAQDAAHKAASQAAQKAAEEAGKLGSTPEGAAAHKAASKAYLKAKQAAQDAGDIFAMDDHHENAVAHLGHSAKIKKDLDAAEAKKAAQAENDELTSKANQAYIAAYDMPEKTPEEMQAKADAFGAAAKAAGEVLQHGGKHDLPPKNNLTAMKLTQSLDLQKELQKAAEQHHAKKASLNQAASDATDKAKALTAEAKKAGTHEAHDAAFDAHVAAAVAAKQAGLGPDIHQFHKSQAQTHMAKMKGIAADQEQQGKIKATTEKLQKAEKAAQEAEAAGQTKSAVGAHLDAASSYVDAAMAAQHAGMTGDAEAFKAKAKEHVSHANKIGEQLKSGGDKATAATANSVPKPPTANSPALKPVGKLTGTGKIMGTHNSEVLTDEAGNKWLNKADSQGYARALDPAVAALHRKTGLATPVFVKTKTGHLQGMVPGAKEAFPGGSFDPEKLSPEDIAKILQHQVMDYTTGNQDSHSGQWLRTPNGLMQIDQGQAFKFGVGKGDPTKTHPPLGSDIPVYPKLWNAAKAGKIQIPDPNGDNDFAKAIKAIQEMPDEQFKALFKPYAETALKNGHKPGGHATVDGFLADIAQHKNNIGKDFEKLYNELPDTGKAGSKGAKAAQLSKADALEEVKTEAAAGKPLSNALLQKAKAAGASLAEVEGAHKDGAVGKPDTAPSVPLPETKAGAEAADAIKTYTADGKTLEPWQISMAKEAGLSDAQIQAASHTPVPGLKGDAAPGKDGLTAKQAALKAVAEYSANPPASWSMKEFKALKEAAAQAGAAPTELNAAQHTPDAFLQSLPKAAPDAPSVSGKPQVDPFKPKAKWSKAVAGVAHPGGEKKQTAVLAGPKGLAVHKAVSGTGWSVSSADGLNLGGTKFKTQKEAKLAAEWLAKNYGGDHFTQAGFNDWKDSHPDEFKALKQGIVEAQWNKDAQAELDKAGGKLPSTGAAAKGSAKVVTPAAPLVNPAAKAEALKAVAEHNLPENGDGWDYEVDNNLKEAAKAAGATVDEIEKVANKPKTYLKSVGESATPANPSVPYNGLTSDKVSNAKLLKQLYDQANAPGATAAQKALYEQAQKDWQAKHSTGPFDPVKFVAPVSSSGPNDMAALTKAKFPTSHAAGFTMVSPSVNANEGWEPTPAQKKGPYMFSTNDGYTGMNEQLRGEKIMGHDDNGKYVVIGTHPPKGYPAGSSWDKYIKSCDEAFQAVPPLDKDIVTSRKMNGYKPFDAFPPPMTPGAQYTDLGYASTSKDPDTWSGDFHMEIQIPKGRRVIDLNHTTGSAHSSEVEILLNRGSTYQVISDTMVGGTRKVVVQLVNDGHFG